MRFTALLALSAIALVSAKHGPLQPRFAEKNLPETTQDYQRGEDEEEAREHQYVHDKPRHTDAKKTPGASCGDFKTCQECPAPGPCRWVPNNPDDTLHKDQEGHGECIEQRNPLSENGELNYMCKLAHMHEVMDIPSDEDDDFSELHINGDPNHVDIAALNKAEPVFTTAQELGAGEGPESEAAGDWLVGGMNHQEYEGHIYKFQKGNLNEAEQKEENEMFGK